MRAEASVVEYFPVTVATLTRQQAAALAEAGKRPSYETSFPVLKVTAFNGQQVSIGGQRQTPFVVGIQKNQAEEPIVRVLEEGTRLTFRSVHSRDRRQVHLKGCVEISKVGEVREFRTLFQRGPATVQAPSGKRWRIDFDSTVAEGQSLLIGFVPTFEKQQIVYARC